MSMDSADIIPEERRVPGVNSGCVRAQSPGDTMEAHGRMSAKDRTGVLNLSH